MCGPLVDIMEHDKTKMSEIQIYSSLTNAKFEVGAGNVSDMARQLAASADDRASKAQPSKPEAQGPEMLTRRKAL